MFGGLLCVEGGALQSQPPVRCKPSTRNHPCLLLRAMRRTLMLKPEINWQVLPTPRVDAEAAENTETHGTASNVPLTSWDDGFPMNSTVTWWEGEWHLALRRMHESNTRAAIPLAQSRCRLGVLVWHRTRKGAWFAILWTGGADFFIFRFCCAWCSAFVLRQIGHGTSSSILWCRHVSRSLFKND